MSLKILSVALWAATALVSPCLAQSVSQIGGPAELPAAGFSGDQYVDSRGCVFLRAGYGGKAAWVARVGRDRKALCGYPPTLGAMATKGTPALDDVAEAPAVKVPTFSTPANSKPLATIASLPEPSKPTVRVAAPLAAVVAAPQAPATRVITVGTYEAAASSGTSGRKIGCYKSVPVAQRVKLVGGGTAVVCTRGDGTLEGGRPPLYADGAGVGAALSDGIATAQVSVRQSGAAPSGTNTAAIGAANPPAGYTAAWTDDRLNPNRGKGTAAGWAAQDQVWTRDVPAVLVTDKAAKKTKGSVTVSTKSSPEAVTPASSGSVYIQVGTFGVAANAAGAAARLAAIGLPVAKSHIVKGGKQLQIVLAGPFTSKAQAQGAVSAVRGAGFGDAFIQ